MSRERDERQLSTADLVSATEETPVRQETPDREAERARDSAADVRTEDAAGQREPLAALFDSELAHDFHMQWRNVQIGFVDDPRRAVQQADELVARLMKSLAESFARQRAEIEAGIGGGEQPSTENMRLAVQRYRSFFERLLSL